MGDLAARQPVLIHPQKRAMPQRSFDRILLALGHPSLKHRIPAIISEGDLQVLVHRS